uniref:UPAR/Ly6 domain-containing protein n=1 Tax=Panagrolaimus superbus TaxID=310955 RepID=A0A914YXI5_9BILA
MNNGINYSNSSKGCGNYITWNENGNQGKCLKSGGLNFTQNGLTGIVSCCDTDLCNSATSPPSIYSFIAINVLTIFSIVFIA